MVNTHWDMERRNGKEAWRRLRHLRSAALLLNQDANLRDTFSMSLQQAEQQFGAAKAVGYESRPLNLFYGLSQAGRAIAAASKIMGDDHPVALGGHGIKCTNFAELAVDPIGRFGELRIRSNGPSQASFIRLSQLLSSDPLAQETQLGTLWGMLVEPQLHEPLSFKVPAVLHTNFDPRRDEATPEKLTLHGIPGDIDLEDAQEYTRFMASYPSLLDSHLFTVYGRSPGHTSDRQTVDVTWRQDAQVRVERACTSYRSSMVVYPAPYPQASTLHPLMAWWAVLFALSMLARYEPRTWTRLVDVDASPHAVAIEFLLDAAQDSVPDILAETLETLFGHSLE